MLNTQRLLAASVPVHKSTAPGVKGDVNQIETSRMTFALVSCHETNAIAKKLPSLVFKFHSNLDLVGDFPLSLSLLLIVALKRTFKCREN